MFDGSSGSSSWMNCSAIATKSPLRLVRRPTGGCYPRQSEQLPRGRSQKQTKGVSRRSMRRRPVTTSSTRPTADTCYVMALAIAKAAAAASPPISTVCSPLRTGEVPVKWPLM